MLALVFVALILFTGSTPYHVRAVFADAGGLVSGDDVLVGPGRVGSVESIGLTGTGQAQIVIGLDGDAAPLHAGTVARIEENGLAGIASHYITLEPAPSSRPTIPSGGTIPETDTASEVGLDQLFDTFDPLTRAGLRNVIRGEAASIDGRAQAANQTIHYLAPALQSTSQVTAELSRSEPSFDALLVEGAKTMQALATRTQELTRLVADTDQATGAIAQQATSLQTAVSLLPAALTRSTTTFAGLRATLNSLDPLVTQAKPAVRRLGTFSTALNDLAVESIPTVGELASLIRNPSGGGDLVTLLQEAPALARLATVAFPRVIKSLNDSQAQLDYLREYTPDVVAALTNLGQASATYDANGHYIRTQPFFGAFGVDSNNELTPRLPADRYQGLQVVHGRCPGGATQPAPDGSSPESVPGCDTTATPPGP